MARRLRAVTSQSNLLPTSYLLPPTSYLLLPTSCLVPPTAYIPRPSYSRKWLDSRFERIAAYEILSEPRDKNVSAHTVRRFYAGGCSATRSVDPRTPCMVGAAPFCTQA